MISNSFSRAIEFTGKWNKEDLFYGQNFIFLYLIVFMVTRNLKFVNNVANIYIITSVKSSVDYEIEHDAGILWVAINLAHAIVNQPKKK